LFAEPIYAQHDSIPAVAKDSLHIQGDLKIKKDGINLNAPAKAAFYSAILPGLGQAYNKQYWKIPIVYGAIGAGVYFYAKNNDNYLRYRTAYFNRKQGLPDEFPQYTSDVLIQAQKFYKRNRDLSVMATVFLYILNIVEANVSAHLKQWNADDNLSLEPTQIPMQNSTAFGLKLNIEILK